MTNAVAFDPSRLHRIEHIGGINTSEDTIRSQVMENTKRQLPQVQPYAPNGMTALLVCGGPSLVETEQELVEAYWAGGKVVCVNGTYNWCIERNIKPSAVVLLDAREWNKRFIERAIPDCKYLIASQCHPAVFDLCADRDTWIWHACSGGDEEHAMINEHYFGRSYPVTLGTTVGIRAISMLRMLGWSRADIFGLDSCWLNDRHHAYEQPENPDKRFRVWLRPRDRDDKAQSFECAPWHAKQAQDFMELVKARGSLLNLNVRGTGLIASMLRTSADLIIEEEK